MIIPGSVNNDALCGDINVISDADKGELSLPGDLHNPGDPDFNKNLSVFSHIQNDFNGGALPIGDVFGESVIFNSNNISLNENVCSRDIFDDRNDSDDLNIAQLQQFSLVPTDDNLQDGNSDNVQEIDNGGYQASNTDLFYNNGNASGRPAMQDQGVGVSSDPIDIETMSDASVVDETNNNSVDSQSINVLMVLYFTKKMIEPMQERKTVR